MAEVTPLDEAVSVLDAGGVVVMPTDTVYGIAARPDVAGAVASIFAIKQRPAERALPVLAADLDALRRVVEIDDRARRLADELWPGPLTLVLPRAEGFSYDLGGGGLDSVAVRIPALEGAIELLARTGPLAVTSANRSGAPPAVTVDEARAALGDQVAIFVDGGRVGGAPSTVLDLTGTPRVVREGALPANELLSRLS